MQDLWSQVSFLLLCAQAQETLAQGSAGAGAGIGATAAKAGEFEEIWRRGAGDCSSRFRGE